MTFPQSRTLEDIFCQYRKVQVGRFFRHRKTEPLQLSLHSANSEVWAFHWRKSEIPAYNTIYRRKLERWHNSNKKFFSFSKTKHNLHKNNSNGFFSAMLRQLHFLTYFQQDRVLLTYAFHVFYEHTCNTIVFILCMNIQTALRN